MKRKYSPGALVSVLPHEGVNGKETPPISAQFLETLRGGYARVIAIGSGSDNALEQKRGAFCLSPGRRNVVVVPFAALKPL